MTLTDDLKRSDLYECAIDAIFMGDRPSAYWVEQKLAAVGIRLVPIETEHTAQDGTVRKSHYGSGRQPYDDILALGWGPGFAAGNVLKYLRRSKDVYDSIKKARWYYAELIKMNTPDAKRALVDLHALLLAPERELLT